MVKYRDPGPIVFDAAIERPDGGQVRRRGV